MSKPSSFVTLTYSDENFHPSLNYSDFQKFMKRLRKELGPTRFFMCGEYGDLNWRPHFHAVLFGQCFPDRLACGAELFRSPTLERLWPHGFSTVGEVSYQSAAYVARYTTKKITGEKADAHYSRMNVETGEFFRVVPEFGHMSLKPGIGAMWFRKYWREVYKVRDGVVFPGGVTVPSPKYYDKLLDELDFDLLEDKKFERYKRSLESLEDNSIERLRVKEVVATAKYNLKRKKL